MLLQLSREGKPHPVCLPASAKLAAQGRSGQPPHRHPKAARHHFCPYVDNLRGGNRTNMGYHYRQKCHHVG